MLESIPKIRHIDDAVRIPARKEFCWISWNDQNCKCKELVREAIMEFIIVAVDSGRISKLDFYEDTVLKKVSLVHRLFTENRR